jgi:hypothetical protein
MRTLEVELDDAVLEKAERKAKSLDTSISDVVAKYLQDWTAGSSTADQQRMAEARRQWKARFARRDGEFSIGTPDTRDQRNARR